MSEFDEECSPEKIKLSVGFHYSECPLIGENSEVKQTQIYDARLFTSNQEKNSQTKNKLPEQLVRSVGCRYGVQRILLNLANWKFVSNTRLKIKNVDYKSAQRVQCKLTKVDSQAPLHFEVQHSRTYTGIYSTTRSQNPKILSRNREIHLVRLPFPNGRVSSSSRSSRFLSIKYRWGYSCLGIVYCRLAIFC